MKTVRRCGFYVAVGLTLTGSLAAPVGAQDGARPKRMALEFGVFGGVFLPDEHHEFYDPSTTHQPLAEVTPDFGLHLGFYPASFLGVEAEGSAAISETDAGGSASLYSARAALVLQIPFRVTPFILGGVGTTWLRSEDSSLGTDRDRVWHAAAGFKIFATRRLELRVEGRIYRSNKERDPLDPTDDNGMVDHYGALAGVSWLIGGRSPRADVEPDPDADGFVVPEDRCPTERGVEPDGCPAKDSDGDGLADAADRCPTEAESVNRHEDTDGCPDDLPDMDGDLIRGDADVCSYEPEDKDGFEDGDGCPEVDNDKDGLVDAADGCPEKGGPPENRGCPDSDQDGDGVVDRIDNCPDQAGRDEFQGCRSKQMVSITPSQIKVFKNIQFSSSRATIAPRSRKLLVNMAEVIRSHPEFRKIRIEGHTDDRGSDELNKRLSQQRAQAVADFLIARGVEPDRVQALGFGREKPLASNRSASGRRKNRRVEFNLEDVRPPGSVKSAPAPAPATPGSTKPEAKPSEGGKPEAKPPSQPEKPEKIEAAPPKKDG